MSFDAPDVAEKSAPSITEAVFDEIGSSSSSSLNSGGAQPSENAVVGTSLSEFPKVSLASFLQEPQDRTQTPKGDEKPASESGSKPGSNDKDKKAPGEEQDSSGKPVDKAKDDTKPKEMTPEEKAKDAKERGALLLKDSIAGKWSAKTQETWQKLFDDVSKIPGMTAGKAADIFNDLGSRINDQLEQAGVEHRVGMAVQKEEDGKTSITMQINGPKTRADNLRAVIEGRNTPTNVKAGSANFAEPPKEQPKPKAKGGDRVA